MRQSPDFERLLQVLSKHDVKFVVVGGVSAVLQGAPIATFDLEVVHERSKANLEALLKALSELGARYRTHPDVEPTEKLLAGPGHQLLLTDAGPLDVPGQIGDGDGYEELLDESDVLQIGELKIRVLGLKGLIQQKHKVGREKDKATIPILQRILDETED